MSSPDHDHSKAQQGLRFRLAPTPSGFLHEGNLYNFLLTEAFRQAMGGQLLLRIDDLDRSRFRPAYLEDVFRQLDALGIVPDLGPSGPEEFERDWSQRHRLNLYAEALDRLTPRLYGCTCSRRDWKHLSSGYPGTCRLAGEALDGPDRHWRIAVLRNMAKIIGAGPLMVIETLVVGAHRSNPA